MPSNHSDQADYDNAAIHIDVEKGREDVLRNIRSTGAISMSPELFEKLYLSPKKPVSGDLRQKFGNPTPMYGSLFLF
jgi:hypothetical protein